MIVTALNNWQSGWLQILISIFFWLWLIPRRRCIFSILLQENKIKKGRELCMAYLWCVFFLTTLCGLGDVPSVVGEKTKMDDQLRQSKKPACHKASNWNLFSSLFLMGFARSALSWSRTLLVRWILRPEHFSSSVTSKAVVCGLCLVNSPPPMKYQNQNGSYCLPLLSVLMKSWSVTVTKASASFFSQRQQQNFHPSAVKLVNTACHVQPWELIQKKNSEI